jgi:radical SAM protein with 4Fe4S-binding SPASM domain
MNLKRASSILSVSPDYVVFSFDTLDKKTYEDNRRGLSYETTLDNIFGFIRKRNELKSETRVVLRYVDFQEDGAGFKDYQLYFKDLLDEELDELQYTMAHNAGFRPSIKQELNNGSFGTTPCEAPFHRLIIQHDGQVLMCAHDFNTEYDLGNVMEKHVLEIFNGNEFKRVRQVHKACRRNTLVKCSTCDEPELDKDENTFVKYTPSGKSFFSKNNIGFDYHEERRKILD